MGGAKKGAPGGVGALTGAGTEQRQMWESAHKEILEALAMLKKADRGLFEIESVLHRLRDLAARASQDACGMGERERLATEASALIDEIDCIVSETRHEGKRLLAGGFEVRI